ncbi:MAG: Asp-tRNA(Asn)/Glu-tRNA(Gln) amidotransferase subunit GatB, partial [Bdellovibrionota bacterium]
MAFNDYEAVIGLEVHVQLQTKSKIFCSSSTEFGAADNEHVCPNCAGMPGALPVLNEKALEYSVKTGLALNCEIRKRSVFARKQYFYPDLPRGYQISQYDQPLCEHGHLEFVLDGIPKRVSITRAHMEEDAGKSTHHGEYTLINLNRAGTPLLEVVSGPDMRSPAEAAEYARQMRKIVRALDVCDGNLEEGSLRCDCNVSVRRRGETKLGTKVEIKNINSFRFIEKAIEYEIHRQIDCKETGEPIYQETRLYDPDKNRTFSMRSKEEAHDYRYFPDPDLLAIEIDDAYIE